MSCLVRTAPIRIPTFLTRCSRAPTAWYRNVWPLPGLADAGIRFVPATHAPDGTALSTPGIHYLDERYELDLDISNEELRQWVGDNLWEMTEVINVWVSPFINDHIVSEDTSTAGFTFLPYFAPEEMLQGCNTAVPGCFSGIFLNQEIVGNGYCNSGIAVFAHEAGHYLGLDHVFEEDWCDDTPQYDGHGTAQNSTFRVSTPICAIRSMLPQSLIRRST